MVCLADEHIIDCLKWADSKQICSFIQLGISLFSYIVFCLIFICNHTPFQINAKVAFEDLIALMMVAARTFEMLANLQPIRQPSVRTYLMSFEMNFSVTSPVFTLMKQMLFPPHVATIFVVFFGSSLLGSKAHCHT